MVSDGPVPCAGAGLKPLYLAADYWRRTGVLADIEVTAVLGWDTIFGIDQVDAELHRAAERLGIRVLTGARVRSVDAAARSVSITADGKRLLLDYDMLHLVPRHRAPTWVAESDLASPDTDGMIEISPTTLAHQRHPGIWGLGDAADVQASRSGGALRKQAGVVADNIAHRRRRGVARQLQRVLDRAHHRGPKPGRAGRVRSGRPAYADLPRDQPGQGAATHLVLRPSSATATLLAQHPSRTSQQLSDATYRCHLPMPPTDATSTPTDAAAAIRRC